MKMLETKQGLQTATLATLIGTMFATFATFLTITADKWQIATVPFVAGTLIWGALIWKFAKLNRGLSEIDPKRIELYPLSCASSMQDLDTLSEVCREVVRDQLGRGLKTGESVDILKTVSVDGKVNILFRYRYHRRKGGRDEIVTSTHTLTLQHNQIKECVEIRHIFSDFNCSSLEESIGVFNRLTRDEVTVSPRTLLGVKVEKQEYQEHFCVTT